MKAVSIEDVAWTPYPGQRSTTTEYLPLLQGVPGEPSNYELAIVKMGAEGNFSPRHRHNFEQLRWAFDQPVNYSPKLDLPPGQLGYFPEGTYYGPFTLPPGTEWLIVQFGGLSGAGYLSWEQLMQGYLDLKAVGEFEQGVYRTTNSQGGRVNKDGYEAIWEHVHHNETIRYPAPKYREPIIMNPGAFEWRPSHEDENIQIKELGSFGERGPSGKLVSVPPESIYRGSRHTGVSLLFVVAGEASQDERNFPPRSAIGLDPGEEPAISAAGDENVEILVLDMPVFD